MTAISSADAHVDSAGLVSVILMLEYDLTIGPLDYCCHHRPLGGQKDTPSHFYSIHHRSTNGVCMCRSTNLVIIYGYVILSITCDEFRLPLQNRYH